MSDIVIRHYATEARKRLFKIPTTHTNQEDWKRVQECLDAILERT